MFCKIYIFIIISLLVFHILFHLCFRALYQIDLVYLCIYVFLLCITVCPRKKREVFKISTPCCAETKSILTTLVSHIKPYCCLYLLCWKYEQNPYIISFDISDRSSERVEPLFPIWENLQCMAYGNFPHTAGEQG